MPHLPPRSDLPTHEVTNQPPARGDIDLWAGDPALQTHAGAAGADAAHLAGYGAKIGTEEMQAAGRVANRQAPELVQFDAGGRRLDEVRFHPAYHRLMEAGVGAGYSAIAWEGAKGGHATHAAMVYLTSQIEPGVCCPMTMTYAAVPAMRADEGLFGEWVPKLTSRVYDGSARPLMRKPGATMGMAMTEKQGGSDVRANATVATRDGEAYRLHGHKWFCSAPMSDGFLTLAQTDFVMRLGHNGLDNTFYRDREAAFKAARKIRCVYCNHSSIFKLWAILSKLINRPFYISTLSLRQSSRDQPNQ